MDNEKEPKTLAYKLGECIGCLICIGIALLILAALIFGVVKFVKWLWIFALAIL